MKRLVITLAIATLLLVALAAPAGASTAVWQPSTVATMTAGDYGSFLEGMAADSHGNLFSSLTKWGYYDETVDPSLWGSNICEVWRIAPNGHKRLVATKDMSPNGMFLGVAVDDRDRVYVIADDYGDPQTVGSGVYRINARGSLAKVIALPAGTWPNGIALHDGRAYITDSALGAVWRARIGGGVASPAAPWFQDALLAPGDPETDPAKIGIGANGIAFRGERVFVSVSDYGRIVRIPVMNDGTPGAPKVVCERPELMTADGLAFDALHRLWIATDSGTTGTSPSGALYRLPASGDLRLIVDDPGWLNYPTMPVFGTTKSTLHTLFIANGAYFGYEDSSAPDIQALPVGVAGLPLN
jgi:sugar lactone lactonase YvrE